MRDSCILHGCVFFSGSLLFKQNRTHFASVKFSELSRRKTVSFCLCINKDTTTIFHRNAKFYFQLWPGELAKEKTPLKQTQHVLRLLLPISKSDKLSTKGKKHRRGSTRNPKSSRPMQNCFHPDLAKLLGPIVRSNEFEVLQQKARKSFVHSLASNVQGS